MFLLPNFRYCQRTALGHHQRDSTLLTQQKISVVRADNMQQITQTLVRLNIH